MLSQLGRLLHLSSALILISLPVYAQNNPIGVTFGLGGSFLNLNTVDAIGEQQLTGFGFRGDASISYERFGLGIGYLEGSLSPEDAGTDRDIVEGELMLSVRAAPWLRFAFGPHIRSLVISEGTERWLFWEGRVGTGARLGTPRLVGLLELWQTLSADVDVDESFDGAQGLAGSLRWEVAALPVWLTLGYRIDRSNLGNGTRTEVMEHFFFSVSLGRGKQ